MNKNEIAKTAELVQKTREKMDENGSGKKVLLKDKRLRNWYTDVEATTTD